MPRGSRRAVLGTLVAVIKAAREAPHAAVVILGGFAFAAIFAGLIAPHDPTLPVKGANVFDPPFWMEGGNMTAPLGTDFQGRILCDWLTRNLGQSLRTGSRVPRARTCDRLRLRPAASRGRSATSAPTRPSRPR